MADEVIIEQALYGATAPGTFQELGRSPGFTDAWIAEAERLCAGFGERPTGVACPGAVFANPLGERWVAVVQAADQPGDGFAFRLLVLTRNDYIGRVTDPFVLADHFPPSWDSRGSLPTLIWRTEFWPRRALADVQAILQQPMAPTLLGGVQALVDGGHLVFERPRPAPELVHALWKLLPDSSRAELWPATFAFGNTLSFDIVVVVRINPDDFPGYLTEERAGDYPGGAYELGVQAAAESGDEAELFALFRRRSSRQTLRLALLMLLVVGTVVGVMRIVGGAAPEVPPPATHPLADSYPALGPAERRQLVDVLRPLASRLQVDPPATATAEELLDAIDRRLPVRDASHDLEPVRQLGDTERQLRGLLWKQGVKGGGDPNRRPVELVELLRQHLEAEGVLKP